MNRYLVENATKANKTVIVRSNLTALLGTSHFYKRFYLLISTLLTNIPEILTSYYVLYIQNIQLLSAIQNLVCFFVLSKNTSEDKAKVV